MPYKPRLVDLIPPPPNASRAPSTPQLPVRPVRAVRDVPNRTLSEFARGGEAYELRVPFLDETLWFVPTADAVAQLVGEGIDRGRIWTADELAELYSIDGVTSEDIAKIGRLKAMFGAEVLEVGPDRDEAGRG